MDRRAADAAEIDALRRAALVVDRLPDGAGELVMAGLVHAALGEGLRRRGRRREAAEHLAHARAAFAAAGAQARVELCDRELAACGARPWSSARSRAGLTPQEVTVARLVAEGRTNREIAADLRISVKTVEYHLGHVFDKLRVHHRTQVAVRFAGASPPTPGTGRHQAGDSSSRV